MNCANHPEREKSAFCQNCGKPLCQECTRVVGQAVFCEPCLEARLAGATPPPAGAGYTASGNAGGVNFTTSATGGSYSYTDPAGFNAAGTIPPPPPAGAPNPMLAGLLGFIPGVGAMYNGQYAKGVVHLIIFAVLVSLADEHGIFGLFVTGWIFYQVFEAYGTAKARRDGTPLPNPFGLNDLGERLGFGKAWAGTSPNPAADPAAPGAPYAAPAAPYVPYTPPASPYTPPAAGAVPPQPPFDAQWSTYTPPANPYMATPPAFDPNAPMPVPTGNRFPAGAIWLIGLGAIFLLGNTSFFHGFGMRYFLPFFLIGLGAWVFIHKMTLTGTGFTDDGTAFYRMRLFSALRGSIWIVLVGVMFLLSNFHILGWGRSWPLFIIVAGLMTIFERTAMQSATAGPMYPGAPYQAAAAPSSATSVVPPAAPAENITPNNEEGR